MFIGDNLHDILLASYTPLHQARKALIWTLAFTAILLIPLGASFTRLIRQAQLENSLQRALVNRTSNSRGHIEID